ncbi:MAG: response regulator [Syntrophales bacterium]|nr:response regulator [Syntrophales bacterium]MDD5640557.1 response regulator [Syntrophales bacterium]
MEIKKILLVDARAPISAAIGFILQAQGYLVLLAPDGETAAAELHNHQIDLVLAFLKGYEADKLDLCRQAKRRFPPTKVMVAGDPQKMAWQAFQEEVDDYLFVPFSPSELCRRVNHCLNQSKVPKPGSEFKSKRNAINDMVWNSLRSKFCHTNNNLFSLMAKINFLIQKNHDISHYINLININIIADDLMNMMRVAEEFLSSQLLCIDLNHSCEDKADGPMQIGPERIAVVGRH